MQKQTKRVSKKVKSTTLTEERFVELLALSEAKIIKHVEGEIRKSETKVIRQVADHVENEIKKSEDKVIRQVADHLESEIKKSEAKVIMRVADHVESEIKKSETRVINYVGGQFIEHTQKQLDYETGIGVLVESEIVDKTKELKTINVNLDDRIKILEGKVAGTESAIVFIKKQLISGTA